MNKKKSLKRGLLLVFAVGALLLVTDQVFCPLRRITGFPCPGCGMTRAWGAALRLDFAQAFYWHPLFWTVPFLGGLVVWKRGKLFRSKKMNTAFWIGITAVYIGCYLWRMVCYFPEEPMDYNRQALLFRIWKMIEN